MSTSGGDPAAPVSGPRAPAPTYHGCTPASPRATVAARAASKKKDTRCEVLLRRALWAAGYRFRKNVADLPGHPDILFSRSRVAVFCDGDFWHGRDWEVRRQKLQAGASSGYWIAKIERNRERDLDTTRALEGMGWTVLRFWESQITANPSVIAQAIIRVLNEMPSPRPSKARRRLDSRSRMS